MVVYLRRADDFALFGTTIAAQMSAVYQGDFSAFGVAASSSGKNVGLLPRLRDRPKACRLV